MQRLQAYAWPGNVRELENVIERALIHSSGDAMDLLDDFEPHGAAGRGRHDDALVGRAQAHSRRAARMRLAHQRERQCRRTAWPPPQHAQVSHEEAGHQPEPPDTRVRLAAESRLAEVLNRDRSRRLHHASLDAVPLGAMPDRHDVPIVLVEHIPPPAGESTTRQLP